MRKDEQIDREGSLKILKVMAALSAAADTHKNVIPAGKKGLEKYKATNFKDTDSIMENAVEGTDVMENFGMEPGKATTYAAGTAYDILNPVNLALAGITKVGGVAGRMAKLMTLSETVAEEGGKRIVKRNLPKYIEKELRHTKDIPLAPRIADELIETGASKKISNPKKALEILQGKKKLEKVGGSKELPINKIDKSEGSMDKVGKELQKTVENESKQASKVNKADIYRKEMDKVKAHNKEGKGYRKNEDSHAKILDDALSPFETKTKTIVEPPPLKMKNAKAEDLESEVDELEKILDFKKQEREAKYFTPADEPPPVPRMELPPIPNEKYDDMGLEDILATVSDKRAAKAKIDAENASVDQFNKSAKPTVREVQYRADAEASLEDLWHKKVALRKEFKDSTFGKPPHEWTDKDKTLESVIDDIDEEIAKRMTTSGKDSYQGLNQKYSAQAKGAQIFEDQIQRESKGSGNVARVTTETAAGGSASPAGMGRIAKSITDTLTGPKRRVQLGNVLQDRKVQTPLHELMSEIVESPLDPPYLEDRDVRTEDAMIDESTIPELPSRNPSSVEEIPQSGEATDIMAPDIDESTIPEAPEQDDLTTKMDETLAPSKPLFDPYVNEEILNTFLPRDSKRILANPSALLAKLQQVAPSQVPALKEMLENDPEGLAEAGPLLATQFPAVFEKDKYGMFDGKILDPMMQQKFLTDLSQDEEMDAIDKANLAMRVRRGDSIHQG